MRRLQANPIWLSRALIAIVLGWNVECAIAFLLAPSVYVNGFELTGTAGEAMVRAMGVLFLMWNVPYVVAFLQPLRHRMSLHEALVMQAIGLAGESLIWWGLPVTHAMARRSVERFIAFDGAGLLLLAVAAWMIRWASGTARAGSA